MRTLRFATMGAGFWSRYQLHAWRELRGVECAAVYNRTRASAEMLAAEFGIPAVFDDAERMLRETKLDFIDVVTDVGTHQRFVRLAAAHGLPVICQKPMAPTLEVARDMVAATRTAGVPFYIHENWRWQAPIRALATRLRTGAIGTPFRARIDMITGFPVFANQPFLKDLEDFILMDLGTHILDVARFLFGEAESVHCQTMRIHPDIRGEDVATIMLRMNEGRTTVVCNLAYAGTPLERDCFPQTLVFVEGDRGSLEIAPDYWVRQTTDTGVEARRHPPRRFTWANPAYEVVQASIVDCHADLLEALRTGREPETTGQDNLKTLELVFDSYRAARGVKPDKQ